MDEFYLLITKRNSSAKSFKLRSKKILKSGWGDLLASAESEKGFEHFLRQQILSVNEYSHLLSLFAFVANFALKNNWSKTSLVSELINFLKIEDPLVAEYEKIFCKEKKPSKSTAYKLGYEYSEEFDTAYDFDFDQFTFEVALLFSPKEKKITATDAAKGLNLAYRHNKDLFIYFSERAITSFYNRSKLPKIGLKQWDLLSSGCQESISWNLNLHSMLDSDLRAVLKRTPYELKGSFQSKILSGGRLLQTVINKSSLVHDGRLDLDDEDDFKASIVLKHPKLNDIEDELIVHLINAGKGWISSEWDYPLVELQEKFFSAVKKNTSESFFNKFIFLSGSKKFFNKVVCFSEDEFAAFWEAFPVAAIETFLGGTEIKNLNHSRILVKKFKDRGIPIQFYEKVPIHKYSWSGCYNYQLTEFDSNTFPLWLGDFKGDDSQIITLIRSNFKRLSNQIRKPEVCRILLNRLAGICEFGSTINLLEDIFGHLGNLHATFSKLCAKEWKQFLTKCYSGRINDGKDASDVFIWLYQLDPTFCRKILHRNVSPDNSFALLRKIKLSPDVIRFLRSLKIKGDERLVDVIIEQRRLTKGAIRFIKELPDSDFSKAFVKHPRQLFIFGKKRLSATKLLKFSLEHYQVGFAVFESMSSDSLLDLSKIASRAFRGKPTVILAAKTAILFSPMDFMFLKFLAFRRSKQGRQSNGSHFDDLYKEWKIPKKSGGDREIASPNKNLKRLQRRLMKSLGCFCDTHEAAHGFVSGKGILSNATEHVGKKIVANVDIANFFPNTSRKMVFQSLMRESDLPADICGFITEICQRDGGLPAGAPTSPLIGNIVLKRFDDVMSKSLKSANVNYTRYADDITISSDNDVSGYIGFAEKLLRKSGYSLNKKKTNFFRQGRRQMVTGLSVNSKVNVPRRIRRNLRAAIHSRSNGEETTWMGRAVDDQVLEGLCAFVKSINPKEGRRHKKNLKKALK